MCANVLDVCIESAVEASRSEIGLCEVGEALKVTGQGLIGVSNLWKPS